MSETMIERVARALFHMNGQYGVSRWVDANDMLREKFLKEARVAIEEMREPTEAMYRAGADRLPYAATEPERSEVEASNSWVAMINAALADEPPALSPKLRAYEPGGPQTRIVD